MQPVYSINLMEYQTVNRSWRARAILCLLVSVCWLAAGTVRGQSATTPVDELAATGEVDVPAPVERPYFDLDPYLEDSTYAPQVNSNWQWQLLPTDLIYKSYLAGIKEPRSGTTLTYIDKYGWLWEGTMGARAGLVRYGDRDPRLPQGFQLDVEGAARRAAGPGRRRECAGHRLPSRHAPDLRLGSSSSSSPSII